MLILGHRGCQSRTRTEDTLEAFKSAVEQGADGIELDLRLSKDGEMVVVHDSDLRRIAGNSHKVSELTGSELAQVELRYGGKIPTLNEVTAEIHAPAILDLEIKQKGVVGPLMRKLDTSLSLRERTIVSSFLVAPLKEIGQAFPEVRTALLIKRWPLPLRTNTLKKRIERLKTWGVAFPIMVLNQSRVAFLREFGVMVGGWDLRGSFGEHLKAKELGLDFMIVRKVCIPPEHHLRTSSNSVKKILNYARKKHQDGNPD
ncbi:MAG: glycerophosphodiester phosphodiesterase family protein [Patescibacteria group bacterium]